jgi:transposase
MHDDATPPEGITPTEWAATPPAVRALLLAALALIPQLLSLQQQVLALQQQVVELRVRLNQHSGNSSKPPSSDPPSAPPRPPAPPRGRLRGGQPGHAGQHRPLLPPEQVDSIVPHHPTACPHCHTDLPPDLPDGADVLRQQVWELPESRPLVTAHQYHTVSCPTCQAAIRADRPRHVPPGAFGPRVAALIGVLRGDYHLSDQHIRTLLADVYGLDVSDGSVVALQGVVSAALADPYQALHTHIQHAAGVNVDETGWKEAGKRRWLWVVVTQAATLFQVASGRGAAVLRALLGEHYRGMVGADRLKTYRWVDADRRQRCWAHLIRNLLALADRGGEVSVWASALLALGDMLFGLWYRFGEGAISRGELQAAVAVLQAMVREQLERGTRRYDAAEGLRRELLELWPARWTFLTVEGVEPTNNVAARALRPAVLWRKHSFGAQSEAGNTFVERILSVRATCVQQKLHFLTFVERAVQAYWAGQPAPTIVPTT